MASDGWVSVAVPLLQFEETKLKLLRDNDGLTASISGIFEGLVEDALATAPGALAGALMVRDKSYPARRGRHQRTVNVSLRGPAYATLSARANAEGISAPKALLAALWLAPMPAADDADALRRQVMQYRARYGELGVQA